MRNYFKQLCAVGLACLASALFLACPGQARPVDCVTSGECECRGPGDCPNGMNCINGQCGYYPDAAVDLLEFGQICEADQECLSGYCVILANGPWRVCSMLCEGDCPAGWDCKLRSIPDPPVHLCVEHLERLCLSCSVDEHCHPSFGDRCIALGDGSTRICGRDCSYETCPFGYTCTEQNSGSAQCVPSQGTCECNLENIGLTRACTNDNANGTCFGSSICLENEGWSDCNARIPHAEVCNGSDDDCDGLVDDADDSVDVSGLPGTPAYPRCQRGLAASCAGLWTCQSGADGVFGWSCTALAPQDEICDGLDNDCDLLIDEDFVDVDGMYREIHNCGGCGLDCTTLVPHLAHDITGEVFAGAVTCVDRDGTQACRPSACERGFSPYPEAAPLICLELVSPQCRPCSNVGDCALSTDRCESVGLDPHASCLQSCGPFANYGECNGIVGEQGCCPDGSVCESVDGALVCMPVAATCDCDAENLGVRRSCFVEGIAGAVCVGEQVCTQQTDRYTWTACDASTTSMEVCDGFDNDCSGVIDDPFVNQQGSNTYDTDEHCGACNVNCLAQWSPEIQHAVGGCVWDTGDTEPVCAIVACTSESVAFAGLCREDLDCVDGWLCNNDYFACHRACDDATVCPGSSVCRGGTCAKTCQGDVDCQLGGAQARCIEGACMLSLEYHNIDDIDSNGCECPSPTPAIVDQPEVYSSYPEPGQAYVDRDCDGIDGRATSALYVWTESAVSAGTRTQPYRSIGEAIAAFSPARHSQIFVAAGYYGESISLRAGVRLYGGYAPDFSMRDVVLFPTILAGPEPDWSDPNRLHGVVNAENILADETVLAGFTIYGYDVTYRPGFGEKGHSSYAVYLHNSSSAVVVANNVIVAGRGGDGGHGAAGIPGSSGSSGLHGLDSKECLSADCGGEFQNGGRGGSNNACAEAVGRAGANSVGDRNPQDYSTSTSGDGLGGSNGTYTSQSNPQWNYLCKYDCQTPEDLNGQDARAGQVGNAGSGGSGCTTTQGIIVAGLWQAGTGAVGSNGSSGRGGGGGGAGGCVQNENPRSCSVGNRVGDLGGTGGGGGAGGCGGRGGNTGGGGGGSFAVWVVNDAASMGQPNIAGNIIHRGIAGSAGNGGNGGHGGLGGLGGEGGVTVTPAWCAGFGGKGGRGGDGGHGAGGGGGCGGVSYAIAGAHFDSATYATSNGFPLGAAPQSGGAGGSGGASPAGAASAGREGSTGAWGVIHAY